MVSFNIYFFILNNTINILQTNIGFGRVTSSSFSLHFTIVDMTIEKLMYPDESNVDLEIMSLYRIITSREKTLQFHAYR